jgi:diguanylate cyclase (GGDEF)-like protein
MTDTAGNRDILLKKIALLEEKLQQKSKEIALLGQSSLFLSASDFQKTCDLLAYRMGVLTNAKFARLYTLNEAGTRLTLAAGYNMSEKYLEMVKNRLEISVETSLTGIPLTNNMEPFIVNDVYRDERFSSWFELTAMYDYRSYIAVPLLCTDRAVGVVEAFYEKTHVLSKDLLGMISIIANVGALAMENSMFISKLHMLSVTDELTSAYNHRFFMETFAREIINAVRHGRPLSYAMFDLDRFKQVNDTFGHLKGDEVLKAVAGAIRKEIRASDYLCRYGGDEFGLILPETNRAASEKVAEKVRAAVKAAGQAMSIDIDISLGLSSFPEDGLTVDELTRHADKLLYEEKRKK